VGDAELGTATRVEEAAAPHCRTRVPTSTRKPSPYERAGSAEINATIERVAPDVLGLLADGVPRSKAALVEALADPARSAGRGARAHPAGIGWRRLRPRHLVRRSRKGGACLGWISDKRLSASNPKPNKVAASIYLYDGGTPEC
jgi:hypothetical protein